MGSSEQIPENMAVSFHCLMDLLEKLIKAFGNNSVPKIEIFIKPYLLLCNLAQASGDISVAQNTFATLS